MRKIIKNGTIVTESDVFKGDILIENEKIVAIGKFDDNEADEVIDVKGKYVMPGAIDVHTHMELQQSEKYRAVDDFYTGTVAAAVGGTTSIIDHIGFGPKGCNLHHSINNYHEIAKKSALDYSFHGVIQHVDDEILKELSEIIENEGIPSFKAYSTYGFKVEDKGFMQLLEQMKKSNGILTVHAENDGITNYLKEKFLSEGKKEPIYHALSRPNETEAETVERLINLSIMAGDAPLYIVHTSTKESIAAIKRAREEGLKNLYVETCTQYLTLTDSKYKENGPVEGLKYLMSPPLRKEEDVEALWKAVDNGDIQVIATDHCPFLFKKDKLNGKDDFTKAPGGAPGVEERVRIIFSEGVMKNRITIQKFVEVMCTNPAKIFGMYPQKGALIPGADADILIIDAEKEEILTKENMRSACDYCTYEGMKVKGLVNMVFSRGKLVAKDNEFLGEKGYGKFIYRKIEK
ncbi:dihydropyrimidinase [Clostridium sp.]|uniref:dihydropyrimidinase n=1 Tax=Clostridium sp. TaxID=1506 RepID=UPI0026372A47|nr:dihydropyrimidinase [Clostridium sp.]